MKTDVLSRIVNISISLSLVTSNLAYAADPAGSTSTTYQVNEYGAVTTDGEVQLANPSSALPALQFSDSTIDPQWGPMSIEVTYTEASTDAETKEGVQWLNNEFAQAKARGEETYLVVSDEKTRDSSLLSHIGEDGRLRIKDLAKVDGALHITHADFQTVVKNMQAYDKMLNPPRVENTEPSRTHFDNWLQDLMDPTQTTTYSYRVPFVDPFVREVPKMDKRIAKIRFGTSGASVVVGIVLNTAINYPSELAMYQAIVSSCLAIGYLSSKIALHRPDYLGWLTRNGRITEYFSKRFERKLQKTGTLTEDQVKAEVEKFKNSDGIRSRNVTIKYSVTEVIFFAPTIIIFSVLGIDLYPVGASLAEWLVGAPDGTLQNMLLTISIQELYVWAQISLATGVAYWAQGKIDGKNSAILEELIKEIDERVVKGEISKELGDRMKRRIEFNSAAVMMLVALLANTAITLTLPDSLIPKVIGYTMIAGLVTATVGYTKYREYKKDGRLAAFKAKIANRVNRYLINNKSESDYYLYWHDSILPNSRCSTILSD